MTFRGFNWEKQYAHIYCDKFQNVCSSLRLDLISVLTNADTLKFWDFFENCQLVAIGI